MSDVQSTVTYRPINGFPGYRVGDDGSVWSCLVAVHQKGVVGTRGESHAISKLTDEKVRIIRARCDDGDSQQKIADDFGVSRALISYIHNRKIWKHVV